MHTTSSAVVIFLAAPQPSLADVTVRFLEGAPTDRFVFETDGPCEIEDAVLTVDLAGSDAGLVFDVTDAGAGVEVFQPFTLVAGADLVTASSGVTDGDQQISLDVARFAPGAQIAFTIDVDDTMGAREITVSGAEIAGAQTRLRVGGATLSAPFGTDATARIIHSGCTS